MALKTNFTDDILAESMNGKRQYNVTENSNGTKSLEDVTDYQSVGSTFSAKDMNETNAAVNQVYDDMGDEFNPEVDYAVGDYAIRNNKVWKFTTAHPAGAWDESHVKATKILSEARELTENFGGLTFAQNASGAWGYKVGGAGSVIPFKSLDIVYVGAITSSGSINVMSKCPNYKKMTAGDFLLDYQSMAVRLWDGKIGGSTINVSKYYDPSTGVLSLSNLSASSSSSYVRCTVGVYAKVS
jgi:hypothetical protein|nr:MAG TPA: hypothetical protein [Bacteriophage sp.]